MNCHVTTETMDENPNKPEVLKNVEIEVPKAEGIPTSPRKSEAGSPEPNCAICLGKLENKSFTDSCFHQFCFTCLSEWSKVKAECPLCKQAFKSIIHNVRSIEDYDQYYIANKTVESGRLSDMIDGRRFRYPSTMTAERRRQWALERSLEYYSHRLTSYANHLGGRPRVALHRLNETSEFRRHIYESRLWVRPPGEERYRETSAEFYRENPACTHRLIPWLNRELVALLTNSESQSAFVLELIMALIVRYEITSAEFYEHVYPYFQDRTAHFVHEFYNYSRSASDMTRYDRHALYERVETPDSSDNSSPNSVVEVPIEGELSEANVAHTFTSARIRTRPIKRSWRSARPHRSRFNPVCQTVSTPSDNSTASDLIPLAGPSMERPNDSGIHLLDVPGTSSRTDSDSNSDCVIVKCIDRGPVEVVDLISDNEEQEPPELPAANLDDPPQSSSRLVRKNRCTYFFDYSSDDSNSDKSQQKLKIRSVIGTVKNLPPPAEKSSSAGRKKHKKQKKHKSKQKGSGHSSKHVDN